MKTMKLILFASLLSLAAVNISKAEAVASRPGLNFVRIISFEQAVRNPGLVGAMNQQLNVYRLVQEYGQTTLTLSVRYQNITYRITGTIIQWNQFLSWQRAGKISIGKSGLIQ